MPCMPSNGNYETFEQCRNEEAFVNHYQVDPLFIEFNNARFSTQCLNIAQLIAP